MTTKLDRLSYLSLLLVAVFVLPTHAEEAVPAKKEEDKPAVKEAPEKKGASEKDSETEKSKKKKKTKLPIGKTDTVITVGDMHCKHCAKKIAGRLYTVKGVVKVRTDVKADVAIVTPQTKKKLSVKALWIAAQKSGFQPILLEGPDGKYEADPKTKSPKLVPKKEKPPTEKVAKKTA